MTQMQQITNELSLLAEDLCTLLGEDCSDTESQITIAHTMGRIFALVQRLHSMLDIALIESDAYRGGE